MRQRQLPPKKNQPANRLGQHSCKNDPTPPRMQASLHFHGSTKNSLTDLLPFSSIPVVKLIRTDTTLDLSQKAEKVYPCPHSMRCGCAACPAEVPPGSAECAKKRAPSKKSNSVRLLIRVLLFYPLAGSVCALHASRQPYIQCSIPPKRNSRTRAAWKK